MGKKILVTGANGFIGTHVLLKGLELFPNDEWVATSSDQQKALQKPWYKKVNFIPYNYLNPPADFPFVFNENDILIHSAWGFLPHFKAAEHLTIELPAQKKFIQNCVEAGLKNITILGTCYEYGMQTGCLSEDKNPAMPIIPYPKAKVELYQWVKSSYPTLNLTWLRLFYMFGKGQSEKSLIPQLEKALSEGKTHFDMSKGDQIRDYQRVEEMAEKIVRIARLAGNHDIVNICSGQPITILQLVKNYLQSTEKHILLNTGVYPYPDYEPFEFWGCPEKMNKLLKISSA
ncbi:MAG: NAD(P)-dependent oxidoreductase [Bacteroidia bacterium]|nr:NAD(P)-dependent oxidoreductase [Bacteroidia bacterium]